jgi:hypothetical protein
MKRNIYIIQYVAHNKTSSYYPKVKCFLGQVTAELLVLGDSTTELYMHGKLINYAIKRCRQIASFFWLLRQHQILTHVQA